MRPVLMLLAATGCSQILGIESPERLDGSVAVADASRDSAPPPSDALVTLTFEQGMNGYTGASDTYVDGGSPDATRDMDSSLRIRDSQRYALLQFSGVYGTAAGRVPPQATIISATLSLQFQSVNCDGSIYDVTTTWADTVTFNTFGATPGVQTPEDYGTLVAPIPNAVGSTSTNVVDSVRRWQMSANNGWIFVAAGGGGAGDCIFRSSEDGILMQRPKLTITFVP